MEIASDHGMDIVKKMTRQHDLNFEEETIRRKTSEIEKCFGLDQRVTRTCSLCPFVASVPSWSHFRIRGWLTCVFSLTSWLDCPHLMCDYHEHKYHQSIGGNSTFDHDFFEDLTFCNSACLTFSAMFLMFTEMMPTVLTFPAQIDLLSIYISIYYQRKNSIIDIRLMCILFPKWLLMFHFNPSSLQSIFVFITSSTIGFGWNLEIFHIYRYLNICYHGCSV